MVVGSDVCETEGCDWNQVVGVLSLSRSRGSRMSGLGGRRASSPDGDCELMPAGQSRSGRYHCTTGGSGNADSGLT